MTVEQDTGFFSELDLDASLQRALHTMGVLEPTPIQRALLPPALAGRDIQASAETGSGKTLAYLLPALQRLLRQSAPDTATRCLILAPTRELAEQLHGQCRKLTAANGLRALLLVGGASLLEQKAALRKNPEIVIATPGRALEHARHGSLLLEDLEVLVLDEADRMLDMGFSEEVLAIVAYCSSTRQSFLLSATLDHKRIRPVASQVLSSPEIVDTGDQRSGHGDIDQQVILVDDIPHRDRLTERLLQQETHERALVFTNTRSQADRLAGKLRYHGHRVAALHGELDQDERRKVMKAYREGRFRVLVATDLAARGLDVKEIDLVINYTLARTGDEYVHRIGRTGRAGQRGLAISLIGPQDWNRMAGIERYLKLELTRRRIKGHEARFKGPVKKKKRKQDKKSARGRNEQQTAHKEPKGKNAKKKTGAVSADGLAPLRRKP